MQTNVYDFLDSTIERFPNKTAFVDKNREITYKDFGILTKKIASEVLSFDLHKEPILILLPKSIDCLASMLSVARSGNFYTVVDENSPKERLDKIIEILKPKLLITSRNMDNNLNLNTLFVEDFESFTINESKLQNAKERHIDTDLLHVLFTSGSTGIPKGVSTTHKSVIDFALSVLEAFKIGDKDVFANQSPLYFDFSLLDIFVSLKVGATLHLIDNVMFSIPNKVLEYLSQNKITIIFWVTAVVIYFAKANLFSQFNLKSLNKILFCGEMMPIKHLKTWSENLPNALFANLYGPTEITDVCSYYIVNRSFKESEILPIGKAFKNTEILLFDENQTLITQKDTSKKGEICVRGTSLSFGYYGDREKTNQAFIQNPLHDNYEEKIYKTGDIGAYNEYGELVCYGRFDNQVKVMGYRVELGEIENTVLCEKNIHNVVCLFENDIIHCFYEADKEIDIREFLLDKLPKYMIPRSFVRVANFQLNQNGKVDRKILKEQILKGEIC